VKSHLGFHLSFAVGLFLVASTSIASAQDWTIWLGPERGPMIRAGIVDARVNAKKHMAAVEVQVRGIWLNYPDLFVEPGLRIGVLRYQIDNCPPIVTTETRLRFEDLPAGNHAITVSLLGLGDMLLAPEARLKITVP